MMTGATMTRRAVSLAQDDGALIAVNKSDNPILLRTARARPGSALH